MVYLVLYLKLYLAHFVLEVEETAVLYFSIYYSCNTVVNNVQFKILASCTFIH